MTMTMTPVAHRDSPYFGLDYYDEKFGAWFFGREADGSKIITNLRAARLTLLHAESGVGKTSLLRAGVAWRLHKLGDDMFARGRPVRSIPVVFSSWKDDPATELASAIRTAIQPYLADGGVPTLAAGSLAEVIEAASAAVNASLLIMLDQFEEYFLYRSREPVPERFADELAHCVNRTDLRANFLIAIREDAYAGLGDLFKGRIANIYGNYLHIDFLDRASAEKAIRAPLDVYNGQPDVTEPVTVQDELVEAVLNEVRAFGADGDVAVSVPVAPTAAADRARDGIATPLLQLVMQKVWDAERAEGSHELRLSTLQRLHGVRTIVDDHLGKALDALTSAERQTAIDMFDHLVTPSGGKIAESVSDLAKRTGHSEEQAGGVLSKLDREFIVRPVPAAPGQDPVRGRRYEIFHDVLAPTINRAIAVREQQRRIRRIRRLAALFVALLVVVAAVAVVFAYLLNSAHTENLTAQSRQLAAEADQELSKDPQLSAAIALQALRTRTTSAAEDALRAALPELQTRRTFDVGASVEVSAFDPADQDTVFSIDSNGIVSEWDVRTGKLLMHLPSTGSPKAGVAKTLAVNLAGTKVAVGYGNGTVALFDPHSGRRLTVVSVTTSGSITSVAWTGRSGDLLLGTSQNTVLWHSGKGAKCCQILASGPAYKIAVNPRDPQEWVDATPNGAIVSQESGSSQLRQMQLGSVIPDDAEFSPDGQEIVTADSDGTIDIFRIATGKVVETFTSSDNIAYNAAFSPDGKRVLAGYWTGIGRIWDVATKLQVGLLAGHGDTIYDARFSPDGREVVTGSLDGTIRVWYTQPPELETAFTVPPGSHDPAPLEGVSYVGNLLMATTSDSGRSYLLTPSGKLQQTLNTGQQPEYTSDWNQAGTLYISVSGDGRVELWRKSGSSGFRPSLIPVTAEEVGMKPDGSQIALVVGAEHNTVQVRDVKTGRLLRTLHSNAPLNDVLFNPDGQQIAAPDLNGQVEVWNGTATKAKSLGTPGPILLDLFFASKGNKFMTISTTDAITVWDSATDRPLLPITGCAASSSAEFSPDGSKIAVSCSDGTARVLDASTGRSLTVFQATNAGTVSSADFSPDGKSIVVTVDSTTAGYVEVWNTELANASLPELERIAEQRVTLKLTAAQVQQYLNGTAN
jgi:WD40 repeat protein